MGNVEHQTEKIRRLLAQIKNEIPSSKFFELGDNQRKLDKIDSQLQRVYELLDSLREYYNSCSLSESNPYLQALMFTEEVQEFVRGMRKNKVGSSHNTILFLALISKLEKSLVMLIYPQERVINDNLMTPQVRKDSKATVTISPVNLVPATKNVFVKELAPRSVDYAKPKSFVLKILAFVFFLPKILGQAILDLVGREQAAPTTAILLGYALITVAGLIFWGFWDLDKIISLIKELRAE